MARPRALILGAAVGLVAPLALAPTALAAAPVSGVSAELTQVNLLNINDFHGRIADDGAFACTLVNARSTLGADKTVFLSAGDNIGATPFVSSSAEDVPTIQYLNALGLQASSVGNHEFDRGFSDLTGRVDGLADWTYLGANVYQRGTKTPALPEYKLIEVNGVTVGVIGAVTVETPSLVSPDGVSGLDFGDPIEAVNRVAAQLSDGDAANGEAAIIVAQYHDGAETSAPTGAWYNDMISRTSAEVDVIFNGHTHLEYKVDAPIPGGTGTRPVIQAGSYGAALGQVQLGFDRASGKVTEYAASVVKASAPAENAACLADAGYRAATAIADEASNRAEVIGRQKVGEITGDITTALKDATISSGRYVGTSRDDRLRESTLGNISAQVWLDSMNAPGRPGADIGIMNPGGLRAELFHKSSGAQGDGDGIVTLAEAASINPFANTLMTVDVTGAQFKKLLEQQWQPADASRPFLKLGLSDNVTYTYDPSRAAGERVLSITINGKPYDPAATYTVASGSFLIAGGDNFTVLREGKNRKDTGLIDTDAFMNWFGANSPVKPNYAKNGVAVLTGTPTGPVACEASFKVVVEGVDLTSLNAPANTSFDVQVDGKSVGTAKIESKHVSDTVPTRDGRSEVTVKLPPGLGAGQHVLTLVAKESGTVVTLGFSSSACTKSAGTKPGASKPTTTAKPATRGKSAKTGFDGPDTTPAALLSLALLASVGVAITKR